MNSNDFIWKTTDINRVSYLRNVCGLKIYRIQYEKDERDKTIVSFIFYDSHQIIESYLKDYENGSEAYRFNEGRNSLLTLVRQTNRLSSEEMLVKANGS
jgi:hypothetical protein